MPIYEYVCSNCGHRTDILHGVNESGPQFCPACGAEGTMRKAFAVPAIHFKGSGWAKKERRASGGARKTQTDTASETGGSDAAAASQPGGESPKKPDTASTASGATSEGGDD